MGWSKWSCQFFFLQLLILLPLSLELELQLIGEDSSCQCPRYQPDYPNLPVDQCYHLIQSSFVQDREKVLAEIQARIKKELIAELQARIKRELIAELQAPIKREVIAELQAPIKKELIAIQPTLQHLRKMIDYFLPANDNNGGYNNGPHLDPD